MTFPEIVVDERGHATAAWILRDSSASFLATLGVLLLGVTAGAMLAEAAIFVPYW